MNARYICTLIAVLTLSSSALKAVTYNYSLSDGLRVVLDAQGSQAVITLTGQPAGLYRIECTEGFNGWTTLTNATLDAQGTFVYTDTSGLPKCFYRVLSAGTFVSVALEDGRITDTPGNPNSGASVNATDTGSAALRAGDFGGSEKQHKAFLSFDTSSIPDGATIVSASLRLRRGMVAGTNPFLTHGTCWVDIKGGTGFGGSTALVAQDFEAAADATQIGALSNAANDGDWSSGSINSSALQFINKTGKTQFRVYFAVHDNNDGKADYIGWYSAENPTPANQPVLEVLFR